jgi:type IV secretion system protein VirB6
MMAACATVPSETGFASGVIGFLDCQAQAIGAGGYQALVSPGGTASLLLTALLTLFIAIWGYRMLFGEAPGSRDGILAFVKIGAVLALAVGWPAYQVLIYDVVLRAPADLAATIGGPAGLPGTSGGLTSRLDGVDQAMERLAILGVGQPPVDATGQSYLVPTAPPLFAGFDTFALGASRTAFLMGAIGAFAIVRLAAGLLLALGPIFIALLLFEATRGLFEGWARALIATALGALATSIVLAVELALLESWLAELLMRRDAGLAIFGVPAQLLAVTLVFALTLPAVLYIVSRVASGLRLPSYQRPLRQNDREPITQPVGGAVTGTPAALEERTRALVIADAIAASQRRGERGAEPGSIVGASHGGTARPTRQRGAVWMPGGRTAGGHQRRTSQRVSASAGRRDRT